MNNGFEDQIKFQAKGWVVIESKDLLLSLLLLLLPLLLSCTAAEMYSYMTIRLLKSGIIITDYGFC